MKVLLLAFIGIAVVVALAVLLGSARWRSRSAALHARLAAARRSAAPRTFDARELADQPAPVQRFFRAALSEGQPIVTAIHIEHTGTINMSEDGEQWKPFTSRQRVVVERPGFVWDARIPMLPGFVAHVHDAYVAGEGILNAALWGLVPLADMRGTREIAEGELMRFFAEAAWYPTALLPSHGVRWQAVDDASADATLTDGETTVTLRFRFGADGLVETVRAEARGRTVRGVSAPTPWEGRWSNYQRRDGMMVPLDGEVAWVLPEGAKPYWRGRIVQVQYAFGE